MTRLSQVLGVVIDSLPPPRSGTAMSLACSWSTPSEVNGVVGGLGSVHDTLGLQTKLLLIPET
jgi:hypothetical protein